MTMIRTILAGISCLALVGATSCDNSDPGTPFSNPGYRWAQQGECTSGERGNMMINEVHFAGSVSDEGVYDADDVFIELWNRNPRPVNVSNWRLDVFGQTEGYTGDRGYLIPVVEEPIPPNGYFVIARKSDGAFGEIADAIIDDLELGKSYVRVELMDCDFKLMEDAGSRDIPVFSGGYDRVTARSMERAQLIFGNRGGNAINWHAYSANTGHANVADGYRNFTLASPGVANSPDYSGAAATGNFE